jgi:hypothetical protein
VTRGAALSSARHPAQGRALQEPASRLKRAGYDCGYHVKGRFEEIHVSETQPISWRSIVYGTPVISSDNERVGTVDEVLGSDAEDIFHGLRVALVDRRRDVMVSSGDVAGTCQPE